MSGPTNEYHLVALSHDARPSGTQGASVTPVQNATNGGYTSIIAGSSVTENIHRIEITIHNIAVSGAATDSLTTIGLDAAGGSSFTDWISDLLSSYASGLGNSLGVGITYVFDVFIKAGTSIGARGSINRATVGTQRVSVALYRASRPDLVRTGSFVRTFGADTANSRGTAVTAGTTAEGSYAEIGTISDSRLFAWILAGAPSNDAAQNNSQTIWDMAIGDATNKKTAIANQLIYSDSTEACSANYRQASMTGVNGDKVYARAQSATATTAFSAIAYGVG